MLVIKLFYNKRTLLISLAFKQIILIQCFEKRVVDFPLGEVFKLSSSTFLYSLRKHLWIINLSQFPYLLAFNTVLNIVPLSICLIHTSTVDSRLRQSVFYLNCEELTSVLPFKPHTPKICVSSSHQFLVETHFRLL